MIEVEATLREIRMVDAVIQKVFLITVDQGKLHKTVSRMQYLLKVKIAELNV